MRTSKIKESERLPQLSRIYYVDAKGRLCKRQSKLEKLLTKILLIFQTLPVMLSFMLIGLTIIEGACLIKLYDIMQNPTLYQAHWKTYLVLTLLIGVILFFVVRIGLFFAEKQSRGSQNFLQTRKSQKL